MKKVVVLGATKGIGRAVARQLAARGDALFLLGRDPTDLAASARDLDARPDGVLALEDSLVTARPRLFRTALLMLGRREEAEDATQKTLLKALGARDGFRRDSEVYTWLYRILLNVLKDHYKAAARATRRFGPLTESVAVAV